MKLVLVFAYRYDYKLVPGLLKNTEGFVDDYVAYDDRNSTEIYSHEGSIRLSLIEEAKKRGADWILAVDPDERLEISAGKQIRRLIEKKEKIIYGFNFREMWSSDEYRVDGIWGKKKRFSLFPVFPDQQFMNLSVHSQWHPINSDYIFKETDINLYHFKMINSKNREERKNLYKRIDPNNQIQKIGYDYLTDETNMQLEKISDSHQYFPRFSEIDVSMSTNI
jgi:hypothetical protein